VTSWQFGHVRIDRIIEFERPLFSPADLYPASTPEQIDYHRRWLEPRLLDPASGLLMLAFHSFLIRTGRVTIIVDTCSGNDKPRPKKPRYHMNRWPYLERLAALGVAPERVDFVLCTHLHVDHVGWNTRLVNGRWVTTFPNAKYLFNRAEWEYWQTTYKRPEFTDDPYYIDSILPVIESGQAVFITGDYAFGDDVWLEPSAGHTPGHVSVHVRVGDAHAIMSGDLMHHPIQCAEPQWNSCFCVDNVGARVSRMKLLERYAETRTLIMPAHFPSPTAGHVVRAGRAFYFAFEGAA